jgi:hypothetical protein
MKTCGGANLSIEGICDSLSAGCSLPRTREPIPVHRRTRCSVGALRLQSRPSNGLDSNDLDSNDPAVLDDDEPPGKPERRLRRYYPPVYPKFQNPTDPAETWSGRGKTPRWLATELKKGKTINDFVINRVVLAFPQRKGKGQ